MACQFLQQETSLATILARYPLHLAAGRRERLGIRLADPLLVADDRHFAGLLGFVDRETTSGQKRLNVLLYDAEMPACNSPLK